MEHIKVFMSFCDGVFYISFLYTMENWKQWVQDFEEDVGKSGNTFKEEVRARGWALTASL
jgi:hypothetical protein